jgi:hypothetical protein
MRQHSFFTSSRLTALTLLALLFNPATGQIGGRCACSPSTYQFTFDFGLTCPPVNVTRSDAVAATTCLIAPFGDPEVTDLIPVAVQSINILELNQNLQTLVTETIEGNFGNGDSFRYVSIAAIPGEIVNPLDVPRAIQLNVIGSNQIGDPIINVYLITFTNDCGAYPVLVNGQSAGWTVFVSRRHALELFMDIPFSPFYCALSSN